MMHNPAHPGEVVRESCLKPLGLTVTEAAEGLGITHKALSDLLNGHSGGFARYGYPARKGRLEHGGSLAAHANAMNPLEGVPACQPDQSEEIRPTATCLAALHMCACARVQLRTVFTGPLHAQEMEGAHYEKETAPHAES